MNIVHTWKDIICRWGFTVRAQTPVSMISISDVELTDAELGTVHGGLFNDNLSDNNVLNNIIAGNQVSALNGNQVLSGNAVSVPVASSGTTTTGGSLNNIKSFDQSNTKSFNLS